MSAKRQRIDSSPESEPESSEDHDARSLEDDDASSQEDSCKSSTSSESEGKSEDVVLDDGVVVDRVRDSEGEEKSEVDQQEVRMPSTVWNFFQKDGDKAKCKVCGKTYKHINSSTSNLLRHVKTQHPIEVAAKEKKQSKVTSYFANLKKYDKNSLRKKKIDNSLLELLVVETLALRLVEKKAFKKLLYDLDSRYKLPSRKQIMTKMLPSLQKEVSQKLKELIHNTPWISLTTDMWTSRKGSAFLSLTAHMCSNDNNLLSRVIGCIRFKGPHTSKNIREKLEELIQEFDLQEKIVSVTSDNAANIKRALADAELTNISCFAHLLNLVAQESLQSNETLYLLREKAQTISTAVRRGHKLKYEFGECCQRVKLKSNKMLVSEVKTRWNSTFLMLRRLQEMKDAVVIFLLRQTNLPELNVEDWQNVQSAIDILQPLYDATVELSGEKYVTASKVIPMVKSLLVWYSELTECNASTLANNLAKFLHELILKRFGDAEDSRILAMATMLDPRFKMEGFRLEQKAKTAINWIKEELDNRESSTTTMWHEETPSPSTSKFWVTIDKDIQKKREKQSKPSNFSHERELQQYLEMANELRSTNVMSWWRCEGKVNFPSIQKLAMKYLTVPATSVPSESLFSTAGNIISAARSSLKDENASMLIFLNGNLQ